MLLLVDFSVLSVLIDTAVMVLRWPPAGDRTHKHTADATRSAGHRKGGRPVQDLIMLANGVSSSGA